MTIRLPHSCFIHVPRTGGLWFQEALNRIVLKKQVLKGDIDSHFRYKDLPESWKRLRPFSFIRHPLSWIESRWSHAREINAKEDERHEGVHRLFDENVHDTFEKTVQSIMRTRPGLATLTFAEMQEGVDIIIQTERLPTAAYKLLEDLEGVSSEVWKWIPSVERMNSTTTLAKYTSKFKLPESLKREFLESEQSLIKRWEQFHAN